MHTLEHGANAMGIALSSAQLEQFCIYAELLILWNEKMNLTAITDPKEIAVKHMLDSMTAYDADLFGSAPKVIDIGTGAGFPGLPLKILHPEIDLVLMDSLKKRLIFLEEVLEKISLSAQVVHARAEDGARNPKYRAAFDIAVSRAVARMPVLLEYNLPFVKVGGAVVALKGRQWEEEIREADLMVSRLGGGKIESRIIHLPELDDVRAILTVKKEKPTPKAYPRKAGMPAKNPLA